MTHIRAVLLGAWTGLLIGVLLIAERVL